MKEQARLGRARGIPKAVFQQNGDLVRLAPGKPGKLSEVRAGRLILDGDIISAANGEAIVMRRRLAQNGVVIVVIDGKGHVQVEGLGLPLDEDYADFTAEAREDVAAAVAKLKGGQRHDRDVISEAARLAARRAAKRWSGKQPQVKVILPVG
jgi:ribonuclease J